MYEKIAREVVKCFKLAAAGAFVYACIAIVGWANFQHGSDIQRTQAVVAKAEQQVKGLTQVVTNMAQDLVKLNHDKTTEIVVKYIPNFKPEQ